VSNTSPTLTQFRLFYECRVLHHRYRVWIAYLHFLERDEPKKPYAPVQALNGTLLRGGKKHKKNIKHKTLRSILHEPATVLIAWKNSE
jgi:hypothetical protein